MKLAISGKGGVGKTTLSAGLLLAFAEENKKVIGIDADPDANLAATLCFPSPDKIMPISEMKELIDERAGEKGGYFTLNPKVDDIPEKYSAVHNGIKLLVMGGVKKAGTGCYCPENAFLKALMTHLILGREDVLIMDMVAGIEHLGRGTAEGVDALITVVEASRRSIETALRMKKMADELKIKRVFVIGNRIISDEETAFIKKETIGLDLLGFVRYNKNLIDRVTVSNLDIFRDIKNKLEKIIEGKEG